MLTAIATLALKMLGDAGVKLAQGFVKDWMARKDIKDKARMAVALEMYENATDGYDYLRSNGDITVRVRDTATGIEL